MPERTFGDFIAPAGRPAPRALLLCLLICATLLTGLLAPTQEEKPPLTEAQQRVIMKKNGVLWEEVRRLAAGHEVDTAVLANRVAAMRDATADLTRFTPPFLENRTDLLRTLAGEFHDDLASLTAVLRDGSLEEIRTEIRRVDAHSCIRCHLVFRWGRVEDVSRFPDLTDANTR